MMNFDIYGISSPTTPKEQSQWKKRLYSFLWRLSAYAIVAVANYTVENITDLGLDEPYTIIIALVLGEITKYLNTGKTK